MFSSDLKTCFTLWSFASLFPCGSVAYSSVNLNWTFNSRPDIQAPRTLFSIYDESLVTRGYVLMTPYTPPAGSNLAAGSGGSTTITAENCLAEVATLEKVSAETIQNGPYIYDHKGNLVYSGFGHVGGASTHDIKLTTYNGQPHLSFYNGQDLIGGGRGHGIIMDNTYRTVATVQSGNGRAPNDIHEFTVLPGGTAITTVFEPVQYDLSAYGVSQPVGWVLEGIFQEIDIRTGEVLFEWRSLDHMDVSESYNERGSFSEGGDGLTIKTAWDYFHLNSVEKDDDGNYLISSRYLCALFKINGKDGSIMWRLNGKKNEFKFVGFNNTFAFQHHARIRSQNASTATISIFDNGSDGENTTSIYSSGMVMSVDTKNKVCTLLRQYHTPNGGLLTTSQGDTQLLSNTNVFMGWGSRPYMAEFTENGTCIMVGQYGADVDSAAMSYRIFKIGYSDWTGNPDSTPALWATANSTAGPTAIYASWNGATQIANWRFWGSVDGTNHYTNLGVTAKTGFETTFTASKYYQWTYAEVLAADGKVLGKSPGRKTYMPAKNSTATR